MGKRNNKIKFYEEYLYNCNCINFMLMWTATYKPIMPENLNYTSNNLDDGILFSYKYDVLFETRNKKYAKHEEKERIKLIAVKITNNTGKKLSINNDLIFYAGEKPIAPMSTEALVDALEQNTPIYLLYLLLSPLQLTKTENNGFETKTTPIFPIGLILGPGNKYRQYDCLKYCK